MQEANQDLWSDMMIYMSISSNYQLFLFYFLYFLFIHLVVCI